ncbi:hypothetical protein GJ744_001024 [Endocarpon pusillum]|uniref:Uncharacterized protein n=1 Tax=Endocarpon pusillum TaxID=364733 RepID=A0A8H7ADW5_9EURO|nr:hypothetical protein GJ744_001024 [Endocarpon pusillum]
MANQTEPTGADSHQPPDLVMVKNQGESENPDLGDLLKANWRDNPCLKGASINQPQSIALIEALFDEQGASDWPLYALSALMGSRKYEDRRLYNRDYY